MVRKLLLITTLALTLALMLSGTSFASLSIQDMATSESVYKAETGLGGLDNFRFSPGDLTPGDKQVLGEIDSMNGQGSTPAASLLPSTTFKEGTALSGVWSPWPFLEGYYMTCTTTDSYGGVWFGTDGEGLWYFFKGEWYYFTVSNTSGYLPSNSIVSVTYDSSRNVLYAGTNDGLFWMYLPSFTYNSRQSSTPERNFIYSVAPSPDGNVYCGTKSGVLYGSIDSLASWYVYTTESTSYQLPSDYIWSVAVDSSGTKWFGTNGYGLARMNSSGWTTLSYNNGYLPDDRVCSLAIDNQGYIWAGTWGGIFYCKSDDYGYYYSTSNPDINYVYGIAFDDNDKVWWASHGGACALDRVTKSAWVFNTGNSLIPSNEVWGIAADKQKRIWLATYGEGVGVYQDRPTVKSVTPSAGATSVPLNTTVKATFSQDMKLSTFSNASFSLKNGTAAVPGSGTYNSATRTATFTPSANLLAGVTYTATIDTSVTNDTNVGMASNYQWTFTTVAPSAPEVIEKQPIGTGVATSAKVTAKFSKDMNASTISTSTFTVTEGSTPVAGTVTYDSSIRTATFSPSTALKNGATYSVKVSKDVKDNTGAGMTADATWSFTTLCKAATPTATPGGGIYSSTQSVSLSTATTGAVIYYTDNGSTPTTSSKPYTTSINIAATTTIKAVAVKSGCADSDIVTFQYTINTGPPVTISLLPGTGTYGLNQSFDAEVVIIESITNLSGVELHLSFDPSVLSCEVTAAGSSLNTNWLELNKSIDNTTGKIDLAYGTLKTEGLISGSGLKVGKLTFKGKVKDTGNVSFNFDASTNRKTFYQVKEGSSSVDKQFSGSTGGSYLIQDAGKISGSIALSPLQSKGDLAGYNVTLDGTSKVAVTTASGNFTLDNVSAGTYPVSVKIQGYTPVTWNNVVVVSGAEKVLSSVTLLGGDATGDAKINLSDFGILSDAFSTMPGSGGWDPRADFNADNKVNLTDFGVLSDNFGKTLNLPTGIMAQ
ncbi:MAG: Ig-like domain-containing protein [Desulfotomaculaceae bacterium]|nr:Ig-like domain-containing protein [Desulfotomaculaceae bacterium]